MDGIHMTGWTVVFALGVFCLAGGVTAATGVSFTVSTLALAVGLGFNGSYDADVAGWSLAMLLPALIGMTLGQRVRHAMSPVLFRRMFMISTLMLGAYLMLKAV